VKPTGRKAAASQPPGGIGKVAEGMGEVREVMMKLLGLSIGRNRP